MITAGYPEKTGILGSGRLRQPQGISRVNLVQSTDVTGVMAKSLAGFGEKECRHMADVIWAPWRMTYIGGEKTTGCIFCAKPLEQRDAENLLLWRGLSAFVMMNRYPYNNGHLMIVPQAHVASLTDLDPAIRAELGELTMHCEQVLRQVMHPDGLNIGINLGAAAGAGIAEHLHIHIVPRWSGDTNYMTVVSDIRVIPQHIDETYALLRPYFEALQPRTPPA
jgi:ATP adenylyltransferase